METEVDIVEFKVPVENDKTLFIWNILPTFSEAYIYDRIFKHFSVFGALFSLRVRANASVAEPGFYAIVKFFSAAQACWAQEATDGRGLFQDKPLKVRLCTRQNPAFCQTVRCLSSAKCQELANYYLGFNGWSSRVVTLHDISITDNAGLLPLGTETQAVSLKYGCIVELMFTKHGVSCRGVGVAEELLENNPDRVERLLKQGKVQKYAKERAFCNAFQKVLLVVLGDGKVAVECRLDPDEIVPDEDLEGLIQVNDISWSEFAGVEEDEDLLYDLSLNMTDVP